MVFIVIFIYDFCVANSNILEDLSLSVSLL